MRNRQAGLLIIGIAILIGFLIWLFDRTLSRIVAENCSHGPECAMWDSINFQTWVGISLLLFVLIIGIYVAFFSKDDQKIKEIHRIKIIKEKEGKTNKNSLRKKAENLEGDEKAIYEKIVSAEGSIFQSQLIKETGFTKVKITRILDRLEGKGVIERKRRGMTNIIILRNQ